MLKILWIVRTLDDRLKKSLLFCLLLTLLRHVVRDAFDNTRGATDATADAKGDNDGRGETCEKYN